MHARMAAARTSYIEGKPGTRSASALCGQLEDHNQQPQEVNGTVDQHPEWSDSGAEQQRQQQAAAGKLKKTAFKLFGGRRNICTLPSFFGGKNKGLGKGTSKKGLCKSKTHDGISDVGCEVADGGRLRSPSDGGTDFPAPQLLSSQRALLATDAGPRAGIDGRSISLSGSSEGFEKKSSGDKSLFLPRPKKGLKGLFNSIRRHRKSKANEPERTELQEWTSKGAVAEEEARATEPVGAETQQASEKTSLKSAVLPPEHGENLDDEAALGIKASLTERGETGQLVANERSSGGDAAIASSDNSPDVKLDVGDTLGVNAPYDGLPDVLQPEDLDSDLPSVPSGDHLSLLFGDVTSLKSFDSFTGCGDIIAEPDIDSITESSTSAGRSRDATKRSSCLVTYQGGGEEMAVPDDIEEYFQQLWEGAAKAGVTTYETQLPELVTDSELQGVNGGEQGPHLCVEGTGNDMDLLTPHSDQQESAPNSDEGYYDSTTPGPEDEAEDAEIKKDRLPRDSYSGDALYEFYEPDDALMSPSPGNEIWFDQKASPSETFGQFLDFALPAEKALVQLMGQKNEEMETEEERLTAIQKQLLYWEQEPVLKHLDMLSKDQHSRDKECSGCKTRVANLSGKCPRCPGCEQGDPHALSRSLHAGDSTEIQDWRDLQEMLCSQKTSKGSVGPKVRGSCRIPFVENGVMLDSHLEHTVLESYALNGLTLEKTVTCPFHRTHGHHSCPPSEPHSGTEPGFQESRTESGFEPEQAVNFSQALVEFTSSGTLFSSLSESLGSSDSGSVFTQNLPALPTMVTFDIVDVEQEGEGECEQHLEMNTDEDIAASFEAFDDSYIPKETFAECDERMFPGYLQSSFQNCNWGVASLPRCLRLQELSPPMPEPLSICRRSRSLDTESLEFELGSLQLSKNGLSPCELRPKRRACQKNPVTPGLGTGKENPPRSTEGREGDGTIPWLGLQDVSYGADTFPSQEAKQWGCDLNAPAFQSSWGSLEQPESELPVTFVPQNSGEESARKPQHDGAKDLVRETPRPMARPSKLPLPTPIESQEVATAPRGHGRDPTGKKMAWVLPLGDNGADLPPGIGFTCSPDKPAMCQPTKVMEGGPQPHCGSVEAFKDEAEDCGSSEADLLKDRAARWHAPSASCQNVTMNVTVAK